MAGHATIKDVAALAGVSVGSISNYLTSKRAISPQQGTNSNRH
jgi:DNA-binding LacI/PurR family transcriptional regulator